MSFEEKLRQFLLPSLNRKFLIRLFIVIAVAYIFFGYILIPLRIDGRSMEPTYKDGGFNFCWRLSYIFSESQRHDVVAVRFSGKRVMLLKRVIAIAGETVEFREGKLFVNGLKLEEPYMKFPSDWNWPTRIVDQDKVYVVGDNRSVPIRNHIFGQVSLQRIVGRVLW